jgi:hypothetical protein
MKLELWHRKLQKRNFAPFPQLNSYIDENQLNVEEDILQMMKNHVSILRKEMSHYFPNLKDF